jgi:membrane protease YdiL (CAAX protease family)
MGCEKPETPVPLIPRNHPMHPPHTTLSYLVGLVFACHLSATCVGWFLVSRQLRRHRELLVQELFPTVPWGAGSVLLLVFGWFVAGQISLLFTGIPLQSTPKNQTPPAGFLLKMLASLTWTNAIMAALTPGVLFLTSRANLRDLGLAVPGLRRNLMRGLGAHILVTPVVYAVQFAAVKIWPKNEHPVEQLLQTGVSRSTAALIMISTVVVAPVCEELLFRGLILGWLHKVFRTNAAKVAAEAAPMAVSDDPDLMARPSHVAVDPSILDPAETGEPAGATRPLRLRRGPLAAPARWRLAPVLPNLLTSLAFASLHAAQWPAPVPLFLLSLVLGYLYERTGSLVAPVTLHALLNATSTLAILVHVR